MILLPISISNLERVQVEIPAEEVHKWLPKHIILDANGRRVLNVFGIYDPNAPVVYQAVVEVGDSGRRQFRVEKASGNYAAYRPVDGYFTQFIECPNGN